MITKESSKIIRILSEKISESYPISEITKKAGKKSYSWTFNIIKQLENENVVEIKKRGRINLCKLNLDNPLTFNYLAVSEFPNLKRKKLPVKEITKIFNLLPLKYFTMLITGSYAEGKATKNSDLDIVIIAEDKTNTKEILNLLAQKGELMMPKVHPYVFKKSEFLEMLLAKEMNYGKLIVENRVIVFGAENYYLIIKEAVEHGFRG